MSSQIVPNRLVIQEEPLPMGSRYNRTRFESTSTEAHTISTIDIPAARNSYINCRDSYLAFTCTADLVGTKLPYMSNADPSVLTYPAQVLIGSSGGSGFISRITILQNKVAVQTLDRYAEIAAVVQVAHAGVSSSGVRALLTNTPFFAVGGNNATSNRLAGVPVCQYYGNPSTIQAVGASVPVKSTLPPIPFCIPLLGLLSQANLPIGMLNDGIQIQIQWKTDTRDCFYLEVGTGIVPTFTGAGKMTFSDVGYVAGVSTLSDASQLEVEKENGFKSRPVSWTENSYHASTRRFTFSEQNTNATMSGILGGMNKTSLKHIYQGTMINPASGPWIESPCMPHLVYDKYRYRVNGVEYPRNYIDTLSKAVQGAAECGGSNSQSTSTGLMDKNFTTRTWRQSDSAGVARQPSQDRGVSGVVLNSFPMVDAVSGINTKGGEVECQLVSSTGLTVQATKDATTFFIGVFDVEFMIEDGQLKMAS